MSFIKLLAILIVILNKVLTQTTNQDIENFKHLESFVELSGGEFMMGVNDIEGFNYEHPFKRALVKPFRIMLYPVTIASFRKFIQSKYRYETKAQRNGYSFVHKDFLDPFALVVKSRNCESQYEGMVAINNARWNKPEGGESNTTNRLDHPVAHVSLYDAQTYCEWLGMRLPSEMEWEYAARGDLNEKSYPWGDQFFKRVSNLRDETNDEYKGLSSVDAFDSQNQYEMHDLIGNVYEWTTTVFKEAFVVDEDIKYVLKGGSFLDSVNNSKIKIRISTRYPVRASFTAQNVGFRCAQSMNTFINDSKYNVVRIRAPIHHEYHEAIFEKIIKNDEL